MGFGRNVLGALLLVVLCVLVVLAGVGLFSLEYVFGVIVPYLAAFTFVSGTIFRISKWGRSPVPFPIPTVCGQQKSLPWIKNNEIDSPSRVRGVVARLALEVVFFRSLFRNERVRLKQGPTIVFGGNKALWLGGLAFHASLFVILFRHLRFFTEPIPAVVLLVGKIDGVLQATFPFIYLSDGLILAGLTYLVLRRVVFSQMRYLSLPSDYFALLLILGIAVSGILMRLFFRENLLAAKELALSVLTFRPVVPQDLGLIFYAHAFLVCLLMAYFPFSKLVHAPGIFLSPTINIANTSRMRRHVNPWNPHVAVHPYEDYENEFREKMIQAALPLDRN